MSEDMRMSSEVKFLTLYAIAILTLSHSIIMNKGPS